MDVNPAQFKNAPLRIVVPPEISTVFSDEGTQFPFSEGLDAPNKYPKYALLVSSFVKPMNGIEILSKAVH